MCAVCTVSCCQLANGWMLFALVAWAWVAVWSDLATLRATSHTSPVVSRRYKQWRILQEPAECPVTEDEKEWSKQLESVRKDVECFFGVLKGRFRILKLPVFFRHQENVDNMFHTCCILHNMLRSYDGLDVMEADMDWAGTDGHHSQSDADPLTDVATTGLGWGYQEGEKMEVESGHDELRRMLMASLTYRYSQGDIT